MLYSKKQGQGMMVALEEHAAQAFQQIQLVRRKYLCDLGTPKMLKLQWHRYLYTVTNNVSILIC